MNLSSVIETISRYNMVLNLFQSAKALGLVTAAVYDMIELDEGTFLYLNGLTALLGPFSQTAAPVNCLPRSIKIRHLIEMPCEKRRKGCENVVATCSYSGAWKKKGITNIVEA